jgi:hypothetical protein
MAAKPSFDGDWMDFDEGIPKLAKSRGVFRDLFSATCSSFLILVRVGFYFAFCLLVLTAVILATFNIPAALIAAVTQGVEGFFEQLNALILFWMSVAILIGEMLWLLLTNQPDRCLIRILDLIKMLDLY